MAESKDEYVTALRFPWLTRFYDPVVATTREKAFKRRLLEQAELGATQRVLDLGCGTGTLAILAKQMCPDAHVTGCDGDPQVLSRARGKADRAGVQIQLDRALSYSLPYGDAGFDRVLSSLFFHHLLLADKERTLREVVRVLRPGGELHVCDWGRLSSPLMRVLFLGVQLVDGFENTRQHAGGALAELMAEAGLVQVATRGGLDTIFGSLGLYSACKPGQTRDRAASFRGREATL